MGVLGRMRLSFWLVVIGGVVMYGFFVALASISPADVAGVTSVVTVVALMFTARNLRVARELADPAGDPLLRRSRNRVRERRGF
jgi:hypothetical protein